MNKNCLIEYRKQLESIDLEFLSLLAKRREVSKLIAEHKHKEAIKIRNINQEQKQMELLHKQAIALDLPKITIEKLFRVIIDDSIEHQEKLKN